LFWTWDRATLLDALSFPQLFLIERKGLMMRKLVFYTVLFAMTVLSVAQGQTYTVLHSFVGSSDGTSPRGSLTLGGSALYVMTASTFFEIGTDGSS
jgi:hypothetical protein